MYNLKIIRSGKRLEIYKINGYVVGNKGEEVTGEVFKEPREKKEISEEVKKVISDDRRHRTLNDARNNIIRLIKTNEDDLKVFITLTFSSVESIDYKSSKKLLDKFFHKLRRNYMNLMYIWILEHGDKNGRLHYHILCNIPIDIKLARTREKKSQEHKQLENEFKEKYWPHGWVFIRKLQEEGCDNVALYVAAYLTKQTQENMEGFRIYGYSHKTLKKPLETKEYTLESLEGLIERYSKNYNIKYSNSYEIGYTTPTGDYRGVVSYFDLIQRED